MDYEIFGSFASDLERRIDEVGVCHKYASSGWPLAKTLIDVGAHRGSSSAEFLKSGWHVFAFEPDEINRNHLVKRFSQYIENRQLTVDPRAVSDSVIDEVPFFASEESSGVSSMLNFLESHEESAKVSVTSLTQYLAENENATPGILKVDTEGFDLHVLRGCPWDRCKPGIIVVEFEDKKTERLGYNCVEMQDFLISKGYNVFVSEWHPIVRYGIAHQWKGLWRAPKTDLSPDSWGNLVALRSDLDEVPFLSLFDSAITTPESRAAASKPKSPNPKKKHESTLKEPSIELDERELKRLKAIKSVSWDVHSSELKNALERFRDAAAEIGSQAPPKPSRKTTPSLAFRPMLALGSAILLLGSVAVIASAWFAGWVAAIAVGSAMLALALIISVAYLLFRIRSLDAQIADSNQSLAASALANEKNCAALGEVTHLLGKLVPACHSDAEKLSTALSKVARGLEIASKRSLQSRKTLESIKQDLAALQDQSQTDERSKSGNPSAGNPGC